MKKQNKRLIAFATAIAIFLGSHLIKLNKERSNDIATRIERYTSSFEDDDFLICAHRGFSSLCIENTREAIECANDKEYVDYIEIDVRLTKDKKFILSHNDYLLKEGGKGHFISRTNYDYLEGSNFIYQIGPSILKELTSSETNLIFNRRLNLRNKKFKLSDLLTGLEAGKDKIIILDLKFNNNEKEFIDLLLEELKGVNPDNIIFQSLSAKGLLYLQELGNYNCLLLIDSKKDLKYINDFNGFGINKSLIDYNIINYLLNNGKTVAIWTINNSKELDGVLRTLKDLYKDVIYITDYPDLIATKLYYKEKD